MKKCISIVVIFVFCLILSACEKSPENIEITDSNWNEYFELKIEESVIETENGKLPRVVLNLYLKENVKLCEETDEAVLPVNITFAVMYDTENIEYYVSDENKIVKEKKTPIQKDLLREFDVQYVAENKFCTTVEVSKIGEDKNSVIIPTNQRVISATGNLMVEK